MVEQQHCEQHKMKSSMRVHYNREGDFLEISVGRPTKCFATEIEPGIFIRRDEETEEVKGIGILDFRKKTKQVNNVELNLPVKVTFSA